jgi:hypothetical protein
MLAQTPPPVPSTSQTQTWAAILTTIAGAIGAVLAKKRFGRDKSPKPRDGVTHTELQQGLDAMRDRVTAGYMAMSEKFDTNHKEVLLAVASHADGIEKRLDALESTVARLDERTRK